MNYFTLIRLLLMAFLGAFFSTLKSQPCDNGIITNPLNPFNNQFIQMGNDFFPGNGTDTHNPFLNSLDWYFGNSTIQLYPNQVNWSHGFSNFNDTINMQHPYGGGMPAEFQYLRPNNVNPTFRDFRWEDGWELLYMNLGYFPDLNATNNPASGSYYSNHGQSYDPIPSNIPYFAIYNRYRGLLRLFANVWYPVGSNYSNINVTMRFTNDSRLLSRITGLLRNASAYDIPLSEPSAITSIHAPRFHGNNPNFTQWMVADFQMAYDPCSCQSQGELEFVFTAFNNLDVDIIGRSIAIDVPINNSNYTTRDFLNLSDINVGTYEPGTEIYQNLDTMLAVYERQQLKYLEELEEYNDYNALQRQLFRLGVRTVVKTLTKGVSQIVISDSLATLLLSDDLSQVNGLLDISEDIPLAEFGGILSDWVKKRIAESNNFLLMEVFGPSPSKPEPVAVPVATLEESVYKGTITSVDTTFSSTLILPGSLPHAYPFGTTLEPDGFPIYNEVLGQVALLRNPGVEFYFDYTTPVQSTIEEETDCTIHPSSGAGGTITKQVRSDLAFKFRFIDDFDIAFNQALDFDFDKTHTDVQVIVEIIPSPRLKADYIQGTVYPSDFEANILHGSNMHVSGDNDPTGLSTSISYPIVEFSSQWVALEDLNQMVFSANYEEVLKYWGEPYFAFSCLLNDPFPVAGFSYEVKSIKFKLVHDMYFDQIGTSDDQINVLQTNTYKLYDLEDGLNQLDVDPNSWSDLPLPGVFDAYTPGEVSLGDESITINHPVVNEVIGTEIFINAQKVSITGALQIQSGYTLIIQALEKIHLLPDAALNPKIQLRIKENFYGTPIFEYATNSEVNSFCNIQGQYQANVSASRGSKPLAELNNQLRNRSKNGLYKIEPTLFVFPNPGRDILNLRSNQEIRAVTILDLYGRSILQKSFQSNTNQIQLSLNGVAPGTYIARVDCGNKVFSEKLIITK